MKSITWTVWLAVALAATAAIVSAQELRRSEPIAITILPNDSAYVLQRGGTFASVDLRTERIGANSRWTSPPYLVLDATSADWRMGSWLFATASMRADGRESSMLMYRPVGSGDLVKFRLPVSGVYAGVAFDTVSGVAYVSNASTNEIYRVTIDRAGHSQTYVASVAGAERIATMVLDQARQLLFVGDVRTGAIYRVDLRRKRATPFIARSGGEVRALALRNNRLYVADARNERVFVTDVTGPSGSLRLFSAWSELRSPVGIAVSSDGGVWVADDRARKLFRFNRENERPSRVIPW